MKTELSAGRLRELLHYDPETGIFRWNISHPSRAAGGVAGHHSRQGYIYIVIAKRKYGAHRLAWLYMTGAWPAAQVDHRDGSKSNNRFDNLREATNAQNHQNISVSRSGTSGYLGVTFDKAKGRWQAQIKVEGRYKFLGRHDTPEQAFDAYCLAKAGLHTFNPSVRCGRATELAFQ